MLRHFLRYLALLLHRERYFRHPLLLQQWLPRRRGLVLDQKLTSVPLLVLLQRACTQSHAHLTMELL